jgi:predicted metal-dependent hydrolase
MSESTSSVQYGNAPIEYNLAYAQRTTLAISVLPDLRVTVTAPADTDLAAIEAKVRQRARWILRQQRELELYLPQTPPRQYISGETHRYLGRQYRLKVAEAQSEGVKLTRGYLFVSTMNKTDTARVAQLMDDWYRMQAQRVFRERLAAMLPRFQHVEIPRPELAIKTLRARWGSCTTAGTVLLNLKLMQVPKSCIDYVIVHELCHLVEHNHSEQFYLLLDRMLPDWRERKRRLNECELG